MSIKLIHIKYRFLFHILFFLISASLLAGTIYLVNKNYKSHLITGEEIESTELIITEAHASYLNFLSSYSNSMRFYRDGEDDNTLRFDHLISTVKDSLTSLSGKRRIISRLSKSGRIDTLVLSLDNYSRSFEYLALSIRELGDLKYGKIAQLEEISGQLLDLVIQMDQPQLLSLAFDIKSKESFYLSTGNQIDFVILLDDVSKISHEVAQLEPDDPAILEQISTVSNNYTLKLEQINLIKKRIGAKSDETSLYAQVASGYNQVLEQYELLSTEWDMLSVRLKKSSIAIGTTLGILIVLVYLFVLLLLFKRINTPLKLSIDYSYQLAKGKLNVGELDESFPREFAMLHQNLNRIHYSVLEKKRFVEDLLKQKFKADLDLQGKHDTFAKTLIALKENMRKALEEQKRYNEENKIRRYQNEGVAEFAEILRNNSDNLDRLADVFVKEIVRYLNAIQGGLFLIEEENTEVLILKAAFAYNRKKYISKSIKMGEGLVGTCALEQKTINLTEIPDDYIEITSGLGDAPPNNLLLLPVMHEGELIGVLELASLKKFDENQILLGEKITESLASSIINARANSRTSELLSKSQQQAAEMAEQEEEMRQNMEELKATQEESARREEELEGILNAIDQAFYVVEYDIEGTITKVNQRFLYLINMKPEKVLGKKHGELFGKKSKADSLMFASIAEGKTVELIEKAEINKKLLEIKNTFSPVKVKDGNTSKILNIMYVIM